MNLGAKFPDFKAWSNFRLMVVLGSIVTIISLGLGAVVVQAVMSDDSQPGDRSSRVEAARGAGSGGDQSEQAVAQPEDPAAVPPQTAGSSDASPLPNGQSFRVACLVNPVSTQNVCQVESFRGFNSRVDLSCANLPPNLDCLFTPNSVTPRANGAATFRIELTAGNIPPGSYEFDVIGRSGTQVSNFRYPWGLAAPRVALAQAAPPPPPPPPGAPPAPPPPPPAAPAAEVPAEPTFSFTCGSLSESNKLQWSLSEDGTTARINCFLTPLNGFNEPVSFKLDQPVEVAKPGTVNFVVDQLQAKKLFDVAFEFSEAVLDLPDSELQAGRDYAVQVTGTSPSGKSLVQQVVLTVTE